jgi:hypothetical protein
MRILKIIVSIIKAMVNHPIKQISIAVTGHRFIPNDARLDQSIRKIFETFLNEHLDADFILYSPLAEGSDQIAARIASEYDRFDLHVPLPMNPEEYLKDFHTKNGRKTFFHLFSSAAEVHHLDIEGDHQASYRALGQYLINHSDILLAVWNGVFNQKIGGTGDVVRIATHAHKPVYWIYCPNQKIGELNTLEDQKQIGDIEILNSKFLGQFQQV